MKRNNIKNKILIGILSAACAISMSACALVDSPFSEEDIDKIGEYSALLIAGSNPDNSRLVDSEEDETEEESQEEISEEDAEEDTDDTEDEVVEDDSDNIEDTQDASHDNDPDINIVDVSENNDDIQPVLEEYLQFASGMTMTYKGYEWKDSLTNESGSYFYDPEDGNVFLVLNYTIYNGSGETQDVDFLFGGYSFSLKINGDKSFLAHEIPINEDLPTYIGRLSDGVGVNLMLTFECSGEYVDNIEAMKLTINNSESSCSVTLE